MKKNEIQKSWKKDSFRNTWQLYMISLLPLIYLVLFKYVPMLGAQIAFKNYSVVRGIWTSPWVGLSHFKRFITSYMFFRVLKNTLVISFYNLIVGFPFPIILALSVNYIKKNRFKKAIQMVTYAPYFISTVVLVGIILQMFNNQNGVVQKFAMAIFGTHFNVLGNPDAFYHLFVWSGIWQYVGYSSIIYIATLAGVDPALHEAAMIDGANMWQRIFHIDIPVIMPTAIIMLILATGRVMEVGFEKAYLMQNPLNLRMSEVINTYVYKLGLTGAVPQFSYSTAIGLFKSLIGLILLTTVNRISRHVSESSLW